MLSMTGCAHVVRTIDKRSYEIKITSVNNRFLDIIVDFPNRDSILEDKIKAIVKDELSRGKISVKVYWQNLRIPKIDVSLNKDLVAKCYNECKNMASELGIENSVKMDDLIKIPSVWVMREEKKEILKEKDLHDLMRKALSRLHKSREAEGKKLKRKFFAYINKINKSLDKLKKIQEKQTKDIDNKLKAKLGKIKNKDIDGSLRMMLEKEMNQLVLKGDVEEEIVRLDSHVDQLLKIMEEKEPMGKKMAFLIQELTREFNTLGDKLTNIKGKHIVLNSKFIIEKMREQIQNIE